MEQLLLRILASLIRIAEQIATALFGARKFSITFGIPTEQHGSTMATLTAPQMTSTQQNTIALLPTNILGKPAQIDGEITWSIDNPDLLTVDPDPSNTNQFIIKGTGTDVEGVAPIVTFSADGDLGEGVKTFTVAVIVPIGTAAAAGFGATFGTPTDQVVA